MIRVVNPVPAPENPPDVVPAPKINSFAVVVVAAPLLTVPGPDNDHPEILLHSLSRYYRFLPKSQQDAFLADVHRKAS